MPKYNVVKSTVKEPEQKLYVLYSGTNMLRPNETDTVKGNFVEKGYVYGVTDRFWEFLKTRKGFIKVNGIKSEVLDFHENTVGK